MHHLRNTIASALTAGLLGLGAATPAMAGDAADGQNAQEKARVSDQELKQFTLALNEIREIRMEFGSRIQQAQNDSERKQLKQQGRQAMRDAVRESELTLEEYNRIGQRLDSDKALEQRLQAMLEKQSG